VRTKSNLWCTFEELQPPFYVTSFGKSLCILNTLALWLKYADMDGGLRCIILLSTIKLTTYQSHPVMELIFGQWLLFLN